MDQRALSIRGGTLIDGTGAPVRPNPGITIESGRFASLDGAAKDALDADGLTLLPGLIDAHTHLGISEFGHQYEGKVPVAVLAAQIFGNAQRALDGGFTTVRDAGGVDGGLARAIERGLVPGPRLFPSGPVLCQSGGHGDYSTPFMHHPHTHGGVPGLAEMSIPCDGPDEVRKAARTVLRRGATQVKVCVSGGVVSVSDSIEDTQFTVPELRAAVEEAAARHTYVTAHAHTSPSIRNGLEAGVACFEHGTFLDEETIALMHARGAALVPTLAVTQLFVDEWEQMGLTEEIAARMGGVQDAMSASVKLAAAAGLTVGSGSDIFGPMQRRFGLEIAMKARILGPMEAILSATSVNARILRAADRLGSIEPGKLADLIAVDGDPLADPELFDDPARVVLVVRDGVVVKDLRG